MLSKLISSLLGKSFALRISLLSPLVASNSKRMPIDVLEAVKSVCASCGNLSPAQAEEFIKTMEREKRLQLETWA